MFTLNEIELSKQHRNEMVQQVENNRLASQLRAASPRHGERAAGSFPRLVSAKEPDGGMLR